MKAAWPERFAIGLLALEFAIFVMFTVGNPYAWTPEWFVSLGQLWIVPAKTVLPIWIICRLFDFLLGGPWRRARIIIYPPGRM